LYNFPFNIPAVSRKADIIITDLTTSVQLLLSILVCTPGYIA